MPTRRSRVWTPFKNSADLSTDVKDIVHSKQDIGPRAGEPGTWFRLSWNSLGYCSFVLQFNANWRNADNPHLTATILQNPRRVILPDASSCCNRQYQASRTRSRPS